MSAAKPPHINPAEFPSLDGFGPTRATLHIYARGMNALARRHASPRPNWWHTSLKVTPRGLQTDPFPLPAGGAATFLLDIPNAKMTLATASGPAQSFALDAGWSGTKMGDALVAAAAELGLSGTIERKRYAGDEPTVYDDDAAQRFFTALTNAHRAIQRHQAALPGEVGPAQLWPHHFDVSAEWYSTKQVSFEENGQMGILPAQINFGFFPGDDDAGSYFYSNPWPFDTKSLLEHPLPAGASWHSDGWLGAKLPYEAVLEQQDAAARLAEFAGAVYAIAAPLLAG